MTYDVGCNSQSSQPLLPLLAWQLLCDPVAVTTLAPTSLHTSRTASSGLDLPRMVSLGVSHALCFMLYSPSLPFVYIC